MSNNEKFESSWQPPSSGSSPPPLEPSERLWLYGKRAIVISAEFFNTVLHAGNYSLIYPVGNTVFLVDLLGLPPTGILQDITLGSLIISVLALAAVITPIAIFDKLLEHHEEMFGDPKTFFSNGLNKLVTIFLVFLYLIIIGTEFMALYLRVLSESDNSPIPSISGDQAEFWPMLAISLSLIFVNAAFALATATVFRSTSRALKGE